MLVDVRLIYKIRAGRGEGPIKGVMGRLEKAKDPAPSPGPRRAKWTATAHRPRGPGRAYGRDAAARSPTSPRLEQGSALESGGDCTAFRGQLLCIEGRLDTTAPNYQSCRSGPSVSPARPERKRRTAHPWTRQARPGDLVCFWCGCCCLGNSRWWEHWRKISRPDDKSPHSFPLFSRLGRPFFQLVRTRDEQAIGLYVPADLINCFVLHVL